MLYRSFEILLFAINWVFSHSQSLHSYERSLIAFGINVLELVICFAVVYLGSGCIQCNGSISTALYSSLRTVVTIGPVETFKSSLLCDSLVMAEVAVAYLLTIVVVANVVGKLRER